MVSYKPHTSMSMTRCLLNSQTVDDATPRYLELSQTIFSVTSKAATAKFDHIALENALKKVIEESSLNLQPDALGGTK